MQTARPQLPVLHNHHARQAPISITNHPSVSMPNLAEHRRPEPQERPAPSPAFESEPVCMYPADQPYIHFSTLLHRFALYDAAAHPQCGDRQEPVDTDSLSETDDEILFSDLPGLDGSTFFLDADDQYPLGGITTRATEIKKRHARSDSFERVMDRQGLSSMTNQRVSLTPRQQIRIQLAKMHAAIQKLSAGL